MTRVADEGAVQGDDALQRAAEDVAEGRSVDWSSLGKRVQDPEAVELLENLRIIGAVAGVHRSAEAAAQTVDSTVALDGAHPPPEGAGEAWGRYRLLDLVGSGSFGSVYRAWDPQLERELAIKILHRHLADDELTTRLLREGRALAQMQHDNVVRVYGVESNEGRIGLCMEFVRGETLDAAMADGHRLNPREAILVGQDVCRALAAVHAAGFVHRDVTAKNIMRDLRGRIVVMDFGTGLKTAEGLSFGAVKIAGTPMYMAPEVLAGQPPSVSSDVYSMGVLLYYLVTGKFPIYARPTWSAGERRCANGRRICRPSTFKRSSTRWSPTPSSAVKARRLCCRRLKPYSSNGARHLNTSSWDWRFSSVRRSA
jgi:serine/threonine-protein kinase